IPVWVYWSDLQRGVAGYLVPPGQVDWAYDDNAPLSQATSTTAVGLLAMRSGSIVPWDCSQINGPVKSRLRAVRWYAVGEMLTGWL
ncbi:MAG: hypothetical protein MUF84_01150, partial [Anaerolineae bacterium]|nr:hypothetical protein [Anaerolineae bacterium]